jgi:alkylation response protein AidB-like acyl-CoA dehydrogenase
MPNFPALVQAATELAPLVEQDAAEAELLSRQTDRVVAALRRSGIYAMLLPRALGGAELAFADAMRIVERLSWADGSAGWCTMVANVQAASGGAHLLPEGARLVYADGPDVSMAGQGVPSGRARKVAGGYVITGRWSYGSGIHHAEWVHSGCLVMDGDRPALGADGAPLITIAHHPKSSIEVLGNWDVLGLRGTGSFDYAVEGGELFVPEWLCYPPDATTPHHGGRQYEIGLVGFTSWGHTGWALGVGRRILDELALLARERRDVFGRFADSPTFKKSFAEAEARYRAARAFVYDSWEAIDRAASEDKAPGVEPIALIRLAMRHLHDVLSDIATSAHRAARGASLRASILQRCYRDAHSGTQHILLADEIVAECGRVLLGTTGPTARWTLFGVKE